MVTRLLDNIMTNNDSKYDDAFIDHFKMNLT